MNIGEILIGEATNSLLLIPTMTGLVMLVRSFQRRPLFIDRNWRFCLVTHGRKFLVS
jgi:hypothetical protein